MSQGCCASRDIIYDQVQTQCCQFILIKKDVFFTKGGLSCCHAGAPIYNWKNYNWKKIKSKKGLCTNSKSKN